jgi:hypothetical protein
MPNRRVSDQLKLIKGTYQPCRARKPCSDGLDPLPEPPRRLPAAVRRIWREIARTAPHLRKPDALIFEILCTLEHQMRTDPDMQSARISLLMKLMADCYLTPATRHHIPPEPEPGKFDEF